MNPEAISPTHQTLHLIGQKKIKYVWKNVGSEKKEEKMKGQKKYCENLICAEYLSSGN